MPHWATLHGYYNMLHYTVVGCLTVLWQEKYFLTYTLKSNGIDLGVKFLNVYIFFLSYFGFGDDLGARSIWDLPAQYQQKKTYFRQNMAEGMEI